MPGTKEKPGEAVPELSGQPRQLLDYALVADGRRGAVVGPDGAVTWMCFPYWDSPALFSELIGGSGRYAVSPVGRYVWGGRYHDESMIWRGRWVTEEGVVECWDALCWPASDDRALLIRRIQGVQGRGRMQIVLHPRAGYGSEPFRVLGREGEDDGVWRGRTGDLWLRWSGAPQARDVPDGHRGRALVDHLDFEPGSRHDLVLEIASTRPDEPLPRAEELWSATEAAWTDVVSRFEGVLARRDVRRSYAILRGLTGPAGGAVAAATTSLPERAEQGRSYDYRYVWIRDQCYIGQAAAVHGPNDLLDDSVRFVSERLIEHGADLAPAYTSTGLAIPDEQSLDLPGYPGGNDIIGNRVTRQFQLDGYGEALLLLATAAHHDHIDSDNWKAAEAAVDGIARRWREPDAGVWELESRFWTHSRLVCAAGLRAILPFAPASYVPEWSALAEKVLAETTARCVHPSGRWQRAEDDERVDASLLLAALRGAVPAEDPRSTHTLEAVENELVVDGYVYRYRQDGRPLGESEGAFLLCGFLLSLAYLQLGRTTDALRVFERNRAVSGPPGLISEEYDVAQSQLRGNLPQAFVHALLIESALRQTDARPADARRAGTG